MMRAHVVSRKTALRTGSLLLPVGGRVDRHAVTVAEVREHAARQARETAEVAVIGSKLNHRDAFNLKVKL